MVFSVINVHVVAAAVHNTDWQLNSSRCLGGVTRYRHKHAYCLCAE